MIITLGALDPKGRPSRRVGRPALRTPLGAEFADLHDAVLRSLKRIREAAPLLLLSARASGWLRALVRPLADLVIRSAPKSVLIPYVGEGSPPRASQSWAPSCAASTETSKP
ncbi:MAG: hypothetical protein JZD41_06025 [Thermoproteus sp.]|nr:hypothetical protein [Thermoproteus sp.]